MRKSGKGNQILKGADYSFQKEKKDKMPGLGWTLLFGFFCFAFYSHSMDKKSYACRELKSKIQELELTKKSSLEEREDLVLQISSQNDMDWVEMILKRRLGLVPEGQMKVYFKKDE